MLCYKHREIRDRLVLRRRKARPVDPTLSCDHGRLANKLIVSQESFSKFGFHRTGAFASRQGVENDQTDRTVMFLTRARDSNHAGRAASGGGATTGCRWSAGYRTDYRRRQSSGSRFYPRKHLRQRHYRRITSVRGLHGRHLDSAKCDRFDRELRRRARRRGLLVGYPSSLLQLLVT